MKVSDAETCTKIDSACDIDYKAENKAQAEMIAHLKDENHNLKMAVKHLTEVIMNGYKDFGFN